ncbi:NADPH-dependent FMN reductase [Bacillus benzoevorans]|uniref:FMN reductase/FAD reductase [NAD(P)H] n=1 Tax=Bacillus benzoevorans TaxID=1456 RepID=A0A7X0HTL0_9BACI|nr:NAD(P)H-dependent oxidoreductase [Bacillus benzoevorans]MBB6446603.1 FMN reductase/FAD reductase [NAD(P)H] [Bacillus benzoevorans]
MKILGISGTITGSKTLIVINKVLEEIKKSNPEVEVELLDLKQYQIQFCDGRPTEDYTGDTAKVIDMISSADGYVIGTPIFQGSFSGVLKNLIDLVPPSAFHHKVMGFAATGGNHLHYLVIENQLKPIAGYLQTFVTPSYIFAQNKQFDSLNRMIDPKLIEDIKLFSHDFSYMFTSLSLNQQPLK